MYIFLVTGKLQAMSGTYGKDLKFIGFDVKVNDLWLNVPNVNDVCNKLNLEFVHYVKITTDLESINKQRAADSVQAVRNGILEPKMREGVVLKPLIELRTNNGSRIISKHKRDEFMETKTPREISPKQLKIYSDAKEIAEEYVTEMRLNHVLDKLPANINVESTKLVIDAMVEDVYREAKGEIVESKEVVKAIGQKAAAMFVSRIKLKLL